MTIRGQFKVDVYDCTINIIVSDHAKQSLNYYLIKSGDKPLEYDFDGFCFRPGESVSSYYVFFDLETICVNTYNHEKSHLVEYILTDRSISPKNEVRSYLDGFISKKMNEFFIKKKIKMK